MQIKREKVSQNQLKHYYRNEKNGRAYLIYSNKVMVNGTLSIPINKTIQIMENNQKCGLLTEGGDLYYYNLETEQLEIIDNNVDGNLGFAITYSDEIVYLKLKAEYTGDLYAWNKNHKKMICENVTTANKISCYLNEVALIDRKTNGSTLLLFCDKNNWNKQGFDLDSFIKHSDFLSCSYDFIKQRLAVFQSGWFESFISIYDVPSKKLIMQKRDSKVVGLSWIKEGEYLVVEKLGAIEILNGQNLSLVSNIQLRKTRFPLLDCIYESAFATYYDGDDVFSVTIND